MIRPRRRVRAVALLVLAVLTVWPAVAHADSGPSLVPEVTSAAPGERILVDVVGWAPGTSVTVVVCGNEARRGSRDCDLRHGQSVELHDPQPKKVLLTVSAPPAPCPCVLRGYDVSSATVVTAPLEVRGVPTAPVVDSDGRAPDPVEVSARVLEGSSAFPSRLRQILGGPVHREVVVNVRNRSSTSQRGIVLAAALGRSAGQGAAIDAPAPFDLEPGEGRDVVLDVDLDAPSHGAYVISGTAFVAGTAVPFAARTATTPVGLYVVLLVVLADVGVLVALAARRPPGGPGERMVTAVRMLDEHGLQDPSWRDVDF